MNMYRLILSLVLLLGFAFTTTAQTSSVPTDGNVYLNTKSGNDSNAGSKESPLKTLSEAAKRVNQSSGEGAITVFLSPGVYGMNETTDFNPVNRKFSSTDRLVIRASVLPDDTNWSPADMPIVISTMPFSEEKNDKGEPTGGQNFGILVQSSHVTIQGLRILGEPVHENPAKGALVRNYPIVWDGKNLEDLRITQCLLWVISWLSPITLLF
jgi:hypothetical protein